MDIHQLGLTQSTASSRITMVRLVLHPRSPPPQPDPGAVDGDGAPPPPPLPASAARTVPVISFSGSADEEGVMTDADGEGLMTAAEGERAMTAADGEGLMTTADSPVVLVAGDEGQMQALTTTTGATVQVEELSPSPPKRPRSGSPILSESAPTPCPSVALGTGREDSSLPQPQLDSPFANLPADVVLLIARKLQSSRADIERMRSVCRSWRELIPNTIDPFLVFSVKEANMKSELFFFEIKRTKHEANAMLESKLPLNRPPPGTLCWGSALGLLALQPIPPETGTTFVFCIHCGNGKSMLQLPEGMTPRGLYLEPYTPLRFIIVKQDDVADTTVLRVDRFDYPWTLEGGPWWLPMPGFADNSLSTLALAPGILRAGASNDSIIIIDESGRVLDDEDGMIRLETPPLNLPNGSWALPWKENGAHLFVCEGKLYFAEVFDCLEASQGVTARLFMVKKSRDEGYALHQVSDIGNFSVYLGPNQSFVLPSAEFPAESLIGRLGNTMYIEDFRGYARWPRVLAINFDSLKTIVIPFPEDLKALDKELLPAVWACMPCCKDLKNHCMGNDCWHFWE